MKRVPRLPIARLVVVMALGLLVAACGASDGVATPRQSTAGVPATTAQPVVGSELSGIRFEVRRDPG